MTIFEKAGRLMTVGFKALIICLAVFMISVWPCFCLLTNYMSSNNIAPISNTMQKFYFTDLLLAIDCL